MRRTILILALSLSFLPALAAAQDFDAAGEQSMLDRINALRAENQLQPLSRLPTLDAVARGHSSDMASQGTLAHVSPTTGTPEDRVRRAGIPADAIAENVAFHRDTARAQQALVESPAHRTNLLSPSVTHVGLGAVRTAQGVYVTQVFAGMPAEPAPAPVLAAPEPAPAFPDPSSIFQIIPPFLEQFLGAGAPSDASADATAEEAPAPVAPEITAPMTTRAPSNPNAPVAAPSLPTTVDPAALRRLVDLAQSLLGGFTSTQ